jgi:hypothetical protein
MKRCAANMGDAMQVVHADEVEWNRGLPHRGGTFHFRELIDGEPSSLGNFQFSIGRIQGDFASPRHRHNFEQFRFQLEGVADFARNGKMDEGCLGYFPEGAAYGPQSAEGVATTAVLQFGGASGSGYLCRTEVQAGTQELKKTGTFDAGVFRRNDDVDGRRNTDAYQAIWEYHHGKAMQYPQPRYRDPIMLDTSHYEWTPITAGVHEKLLGVFTERRTEAQLIKLEKGAVWPASNRSVYLVLIGTGTVARQPYRALTAIHLSDGERETLFEAHEETTVLRLGLPDLAGLGEISGARREAAE